MFERIFQFVLLLASLIGFSVSYLTAKESFCMTCSLFENDKDVPGWMAGSSVCILRGLLRVRETAASLSSRNEY